MADGQFHRPQISHVGSGDRSCRAPRPPPSGGFLAPSADASSQATMSASALAWQAIDEEATREPPPGSSSRRSPTSMPARRGIDVEPTVTAPEPLPDETQRGSAKTTPRTTPTQHRRPFGGPAASVATQAASVATQPKHHKGSTPPVQRKGSTPPVQRKGSTPPVQRKGSTPPVQRKQHEDGTIPHNGVPAGVAAARTNQPRRDKPWYGDNPQLEGKIPQLLQAKRPEAIREARALLQTCADEDAPVTQFYLGVVTGQLESEAAACAYYERALKKLPLLHAARNNLIRGLMRRGSKEDMRQALEHARLAAGLQPEIAEMQYQLGVVLMQQQLWDQSAAAYEATIKLQPNHMGAFVNGVHALQQMPPADHVARRRLERFAKLGVKVGLWAHWQQRPPHLMPRLRSQPWWTSREFPWCGLLERHYAEIRSEVLHLLRAPQNFTPVGGRAVHDHTLVAAGEWKEFPLFGNGQRYEQNCARCPVTTAVMEKIPEAIELAMASGGETLFSTLKPGTHLRPHCGSTNTRLTCHLGILVPDGCSIRAGEEWGEWREGECIVFDDSWEHEVHHRVRAPAACPRRMPPSRAPVACLHFPSPRRTALSCPPEHAPAPQHVVPPPTHAHAHGHNPTPPLLRSRCARALPLPAG